jgi:hypothetical protein
MSYDGTEFELLTGHSLTNRASNHSFGINSLSENKTLLFTFPAMRIHGKFGSFI